jgi:hypothetical protein
MVLINIKYDGSPLGEELMIVKKAQSKRGAVWKGHNVGLLAEPLWCYKYI